MVEQVDFLHQELTGLVEGYRPNGGNRWHYHCHPAASK